MNDNMNEINDITISIPMSSLAENEQISLIALFAREMSNQKQTTILPTAISTDEGKINFTYSADDKNDIREQVEKFTDVTMELCERARREAKQEAEEGITKTQSPQLPISDLLKIRDQILVIRSSGKHNMFDAPAVQREAFELGFYELVNFIEEHKADYMHFILTGDLQNLTLSLYPVPGTKVVLDEMPYDPNPIPSDTVGTVEGYDDECEILMNWNNGRKLKLIPGVDRYHTVEE